MRKEILKSHMYGMVLFIAAALAIISWTIYQNQDLNPKIIGIIVIAVILLRLMFSGIKKI